MNRILVFLCVFLFLFSFSNVYSNPFSENSGFQSGETIEKPGFDKTILLKITIMQQKLKMRLSSLINQFKNGGAFLPFLTIIFISFLYGVLHAAGPGHGKAFAAAFMLSQKPGVLKAVLFGSSIAFFHGISGSFLVLFLNFIFKKTITGSMAEIEYYTKLTSFFLLALLGGILVLKSLFDLFKKEEKENTKPENIFLWGFAAGIIPCPGVTMIMLFCLSLGMPYFGFFLSLVVSSGMAVTISLVVLSVIMGKKLSYGFASEKTIETGEKILGLLSGGLVMAGGTLFFMSTLKIGRYFI